MGATATALLIGIATPGDLPVAWALDLMRGVAAECARAGAAVAGGDVTGSDTLMLGVTALGDLDGAAPVTRAGARPGDILAVAGRLGWSAAGLALLAAGAADAGPRTGRGPPPSAAALPRRTAGGPARRHLDDRHQRRADPGPRARGRGERRVHRHRPGPAARHRAAARGRPAPSAPTGWTGRWPAARITRWPPPSRPGPSCPPAGRRWVRSGPGRACWSAPARAAVRAAGIIFAAAHRNYRPGRPQKVGSEWLICRQLDINPLMPSHRQGSIPKHRARRPDENSGRHSQLNAAIPAKRIAPESGPAPDHSGARPAAPEPPTQPLPPFGGGRRPAAESRSDASGAGDGDPPPAAATAG